MCTKLVSTPGSSLRGSFYSIINIMINIVIVKKTENIAIYF